MTICHSLATNWRLGLAEHGSALAGCDADAGIWSRSLNTRQTRPIPAVGVGAGRVAIWRVRRFAPSAPWCDGACVARRPPVASSMVSAGPAHQALREGPPSAAPPQNACDAPRSPPSALAPLRRSRSLPRWSSHDARGACGATNSHSGQVHAMDQDQHRHPHTDTQHSCGAGKGNSIGLCLWRQGRCRRKPIRTVLKQWSLWAPLGRECQAEAPVARLRSTMPLRSTVKMTGCLESCISGALPQAHRLGMEDESLAMNLEFYQALRLWHGSVLWHSEA